MSVRVFFEPKIAPHAPELYSFERTDAGVTPGDAVSEAGLAR